MFVVAFRYHVPDDGAGAYVALQERVAELYRQEGCRHYLVLRPRTARAQWEEYAFFDSREAFAAAEARLLATDEIQRLFAEFLRVTRLTEAQLHQLEFDVVVEKVSRHDLS